MKYTLAGLISRLDEPEIRISQLKDKAMGLTQTDKQKEKNNEKNKDSLRSIWENIRWTNIHILEIQEEEENGKRNLVCRLGG